MPGPDKTVLITDVRRGSAVAIIRSFGQKGWRVIAGDSIHNSPGFYSRYTSAPLGYPSPAMDAPAFLSTLLAAIKKYEVDLLIPVTDEAILPIKAHRDTFERLCQVAMAEDHALETTLDKYQTIQLAQQSGVPVPSSHLVHTVDEASQIVAEMDWPVVLKPVVSRGYSSEAGSTKQYAVSYAGSEAELRSRMVAYEGQCPVLLQEYYQGSGQGVELLACRGKTLAAFQHKRLCEVPPSGGASAFRESVALDAQLLTYATRLVERLDWTGLIMVEFKLGDEGAKLMEINGRVWGSLPLAVASGVDFPGLLADLYAKGLPKTPEPLTDYTLGVRLVNPDLMLVWFGRVLFGRRNYPYLPFPSRRQALSVLLQLLSGRAGYDLFSREDPHPGLAEGRRLIRKALSKFRKGD